MFKNRKNSVSICLLGGKKKTVKQMKKYRSSRPKVFCKKIVLKSPAKFKGKPHCWSQFLTELQL